jgi:AcrR family transcriptional regulator
MRSISLLGAETPGKSEQARARLLEAAVRIFGEKGLKGATVREIAKAAGQNVAAIAYYFGSKEKLYDTIIEGIVREFQHTLRDILERIDELERLEHPDPVRALAVLKAFLGAVYLRVLSRKEALPIARVIIREQLGPTPAFEILYHKAFRQLHTRLCFLVGVVVARDPREPQIILRTHMLMGQVYFFAMSREAILRRLGWRTLEGKNAQLVIQVLEQNIDALLLSLAQADTNLRSNLPS